MIKEISNWKPNSWRELEIKQQPIYPNMESLHKVESRLKKSVSLVTPNEIDTLKQKLSKVVEGKSFLLQGGDCAESFAEFSEDNIRNYIKVIVQMTVALMSGAEKPIVKVGRIAGQFAKPRSDNFEEINGQKLPSYRGDMVNGIDFDELSRIPDPERLFKAYNQSAATLNYIRSLTRGGYSSLRRVSQWNNDFINNCTNKDVFLEQIKNIDKSFKFMESCGLNLDKIGEFNEAEFFTSHEGLLLNYEEALTRFDERTEKYYACSSHMLWIGDRTRKLDEAHIEFMKGIANPIGVKVGPSMTEDELIELIDNLNPENEAGRLTLISRMGSDNVNKFLPSLVRRVKQEGKSVIWSCDPMHGNTVKSPNGLKTRHFDKILSEVRNCFAIHKSEGSIAGGVHFEMTGQNVTECVGGAQEISEVDLANRYRTHCDPRLNASQSIELAFLIANEIKS